MSKRRKPWNWFRIGLLGLLVAAAVYVNQVIVPTVPPIGIPSATPTRDPESFISEAEELFRQGKLNQAIEAYKQVVHARPKDSASYIAMARAQVWAGQYIDAQTSAEYAILLNPTNSTAHAVRGWALDFQKDYLASETSIKRALDLDGNNALAHAYYAELLTDQSLNNTGPLDVLQKASDESKKALALDPALLEAHRARGYLLYATNNYEQAVIEYQAAIAINKNIEDLQLNLGLSYQGLAINDKAVDAYVTANTLNPTDPLPNFYISRVYVGIGEYGKALQYAQQAVKAAPANANYHGNLGVMLYRNFKYPEAAQELAFVVNGGTLEDGTAITALDLTSSSRIAEYYFIYGVTLAKMKPPRCGEALQIAQQILDKLRNDDTWVFNANEVIRLCSEATPVAGGSETPAAHSTSKTPTTSPTPKLP
jgi:tetratricopeptide (TPR) repeat protein